jgi:hypothetical protein
LFTSKTGKIIKAILKSRGFFNDVFDLAKVLKPIKEAITSLEAKTTNLADCYLGYVKLAAAIKTIPIDQHLMFRRACIKIFNERFKVFDYDEYLLTYYLHPQYRGLYSIFFKTNLLFILKTHFNIYRYWGQAVTICSDS